MEINDSKPHSDENNPSGGSNNDIKDNSAEKSIFVNHPEISWHERRKHWVGDESKKSRKAPSEPIMSWTTTYEELLCSNEPFHQQIPLAEMVDFLVDTWHEEGLYD
ncbi:Bifunctional aas [Tripterygium wilfordii]|uniref:Bifunctional aas n=1 Tax=Tripterygium wilfordii TaxID=458696 RepID=A0A7J7CTT3_TRIWF|nr:uncharacterized protein LOC120012714 [Tripterygium wilfordii]XP_038720084.1 uncharacterized protein LOC120012714 [Tripterygium wilfordii]XP_038720085.1 uncharacterized protein LOC120012714 [Tripterygium wilfordii]XP_038720086.1 uncharacterized protein LOC120012714 [Tripterygium wilfordii]KAF5737522.1 Bifunctional aas [Tripterygium wilfordii]